VHALYGTNEEDLRTTGHDLWRQNRSLMELPGGHSVAFEQGEAEATRGESHGTAASDGDGALGMEYEGGPAEGGRLDTDLAMMKARNGAECGGVGGVPWRKSVMQWRSR
jgi:hypothetical protein